MNFLCDDVGIYPIRPFLFSHVSKMLTLITIVILLIKKKVI